MMFEKTWGHKSCSFRSLLERRLETEHFYLLKNIQKIFISPQQLDVIQ